MQYQLSSAQASGFNEGAWEDLVRLAPRPLPTPAAVAVPAGERARHSWSWICDLTLYHFHEGNWYDDKHL